MRKNPRHYSILIVPDAKGKTINFRISSLILKTFLYFVIVIAFLSVIGIFQAGRIAIKLRQIDYLVKENESLQNKNQKIKIIAKELAEIKEKENRIRIIASAFLNKGAALSSKDKTNKQADKDKDVDAFVKRVQKKQKAMELLATEGSKASQAHMLSAIPTLRPLDGWITRGFSLDISSDGKYKGHQGVDIAAAKGSPILAASKGVVVFAGWHKFLGNLIIINHGFGYKTYYGHCSRLLVKKGDIIERGETIALTGNSGRSTAPHLHYEILKNGTPVDPLLFFIH